MHLRYLVLLLAFTQVCLGASSSEESEYCETFDSPYYARKLEEIGRIQAHLDEWADQKTGKASKGPSRSNLARAYTTLYEMVTDFKGGAMDDGFLSDTLFQKLLVVGNLDSTQEKMPCADKLQPLKDLLQEIAEKLKTKSLRLPKAQGPGLQPFH